MKTNLRSLPVASTDYPLTDGQSVQLSIVIPTYNERENLPILIARLQEIMLDLSFEIIVVDDDSEDGTWQVAEQFARDYSNISLIRRVNRKGLSSAITEGFLLGKGKYLVVLDADLQHDERLIRGMLDEIETCDVVIGSRYMDRKSVPGWDSWRSKLSRTGTVVAQKILHQGITDPLSGFFMLRREIIHEVAPQLFSDGYKILVDILLKCPGLKVRELPYEFRTRQHGTSKLTAAVAFDFADLLISRTIPSRFNLQFVRYGMVGASGIGVHFLALYALHVVMGMRYPLALLIAIEAAMVSNYVWNNQWTFKDHRLLGAEWWLGFLRYNLACIMGTLFNLAIGWYLVDKGIPWTIASVLGIWVGVSWNFLTSKAFTWGR